MNETLAVLNAHHSQRAYTTQPVNDSQLDEIIAVGHRSPTSMNGQQVSVVVVRDAATRAKIAEIAGGQAWIATAPVFLLLVVDFHKTELAVQAAGETQHIQEGIEALLVGGVDCGIALGNMMTAARALGLGIVPIGAVRRDPQAMIDLLGLPKNTFPIVGMCVGHPANAVVQKPRLPISTFRHEERYLADSELNRHFAAYDQTLMAYWAQIGRTDGLPWTQNTAQYYRQVYFAQVKPVAAAQGFSASR